jgi:hypothetical protein
MRTAESVINRDTIPKDWEREAKATGAPIERHGDFLQSVHPRRFEVQTSFRAQGTALRGVPSSLRQEP